VAGISRSGLAAFHATISGSVQGVGFRYSARREALRLGLVGWVRNLGDGEVEVLAEGLGSALVDFREWLEEGPPGAFIASVNVEKREPTGRYADFTIEY
jgi:acylphosphatase